MSRLRVAHVYKDVYPPVVGGIEKHIDLLRRALPEVESHVVVCSRRRRGSVRASPGGSEVRVAELGPRVLSVPIAPGFPRRLASLDADLVHVHMPFPLGEASALIAARGRPIVASYHCDIVRQERYLPLYRPLARALLRRAEAVVVGSRRLLADSVVLPPETQAEVVPYGVDVERLDPAAVPARDREALRSRYGSPLVLAVARLVYYKGLGDLIDAAQLLDAAVVIVGGGPLEAELRDQARGVRNVHLTGQLGEDELRAHLSAADCFVLPSDSRAESFGIATLEAQAMALPAVVTDVGTATVEAIAPGETGVVAPAGDPRALAEAISSLTEDPRRAAEMGRAGRERTVREHSVSAMVEPLREIYGRFAPAGS